MRLDTFLSISRLIKRRSLAKKACDFRAVLIDGIPAKASHNVRIGQKIQIDFSNRVLEVEILSVPPEKSLKKEEAKNLYKIIREERKRVLE
ncbi:MAG: RNA-binding S4 domain-containing protein [candidate division Zixibacteria bacterium]|nr:RNA-binding S4 domain-containing protein [candidate division Zixibacteria bacterium]